MIQISAWHPLVAAVYFLSVLLIAMFHADPYIAALALLGGVLCAVKLEGGRRFVRGLGWHVGLFVLVAVTNPLFSHKGVTPLFFLNGNPITAEALQYGVYLGVMLLAVLYWFQCFNSVMSEDKLLYLLGRIAPKLSLLVSSALRFVPMLKAQAVRIRQAQTAMGLYHTDTWTDKLKAVARVYSALITWALEKAIDTGASMKARGYGLPGRRCYSLYTFRGSDAFTAAMIVTADAVLLMAMASGEAFRFYPSVAAPLPEVPYVAALTAFAVLCLLPFILEVKEGLRWTYYRSKI
ncbi:MAG: energy-coupling factor transporter transmembrane protein EcfT [Clostridia bacterium]|nr:energy-coupling factor transporter transmembrane protein EcfT [Clostridia bacterium]